MEFTQEVHDAVRDYIKEVEERNGAPLSGAAKALLAQMQYDSIAFNYAMKRLIEVLQEALSNSTTDENNND